MALKISYIKQQAPTPKVTVNVRLYRTRDGRRLVPEGHQDAAFLFCTPGHEVSRAEFERFELDPSLEAVEAAAEPGEEGEPEAKAVDGPPEDKAVRKRRTKKAKG